MHTVILEGNDLQMFREYTRMGLEGQLGELSTVQLYVQDDGRIVLGTNGYTSEPMGRPNAPLPQPTTGDSYPDPEIPATIRNRVNGEGSGNPYANVPEEDSPENLPPVVRMRLLEHDVAWLKGVVQRAESRLGVSLRS